MVMVALTRRGLSFPFPHHSQHFDNTLLDTHSHTHLRSLIIAFFPQSIRYEW